VWVELDRLVNDASASGIKILFTVLRSPSWANPSPNGPPSNNNDLGDFMAAMAGRYKGKVQAYEVWNEQNLADQWTGHALSASSYGRPSAHRLSARQGRRPDAVVVSGGLAPTGVNDPNIAIDDRVIPASDV